MECNKCLLAIDRKHDRYTICEGKCAKRYHATCVGLTEPTVCALFAKNILWMCDDCLTEYCASRDADCPVPTETDSDDIAQTNTVESDIDDLRLKIAEIADTLASIVPYHQFCENAHSSSIPSPKFSSTHLFNGTKVTRDDNTSSDMLSHDSISDNTFSLFLTNVDRRATEEDLNHLVCECLDITDRKTIRIRKLIPKGRSIDELDFISVKVMMNVKLKELAMAPSTWPVGIRYREFENRCVVWIPKCETQDC